jgi:excinuclease ABC subunit A
MTTIEIRGAREHNLRGVDVDLPLGRLVVFCGPSGSGKTSFLFDVVHAEGQRRYLEALALTGRTELPSPPRVDRIDHLPPTIALAQRTGTLAAWSTVGSLSEVTPLLRVLFARAGVQHCPVCGRAIVPVSLDELSARLLVLPEGARLQLETPVQGRDASVLAEIGRAGFSRVRIDDEIVRVEDLEPRRLERARVLRLVVDRIRIEPERRARIHDSLRLALRAGRGVVVAVHDGGEETFVDHPWCEVDDRAFAPLEPERFDPRRTPGCPTCAGAGKSGEGTCPDCGGSGLSENERAVRWRGHGLGDLVSGTVSGLRRALSQVEEPGPVERATLGEVDRRLQRVEELGLGHLPLARTVDTLSATELRRLRLARTVATPLAGVLYILDEPAAGLDEVLAGRVAQLVRELVGLGNTVAVVEHHASLLLAADTLVEFGPGAGSAGGRVVFSGTPAELVAADTRTGRFLAGLTRAEPGGLPVPTARAVLEGRWRHGRPSPTLELPRERLVVVTGPSGCGKSSFVRATQAALEGTPLAGTSLAGAEGLTRLVAADRAAGRSSRALVATYVGVWDVLRDLLAQTKDAQIRALPAASFSLAGAGGRCEACKGTGERWIDLGPLPEVVETCPVCHGARFQQDVLEVRWKGLHAAELLELDAERGLPLLGGHPRLEGALRALVRAGLGYVPLGQSLASLSGGEARRLVIARELSRAARRGGSDVLVLLDDPTVGLHPDDVLALVRLFRDLRDEGSTVWCASVEPLLVDSADAVVQLLPDPVDSSGEG